MRHIPAAALGWTLAVVLALAGPAAAQVIEKHSGVIVDVDERAGTFVALKITVTDLPGGALIPEE